MGKPKTTTRFIVLITMFAILVASSISSFSHAHSLSEKVVTFSFWTEICTTEGTKRLKMEGNRNVSPSDFGDTRTHSQHCFYCYSSSSNFHALPYNGGFVLPVLSSSSSAPSLFYHSPYRLFAWSPAQPRAPPSYF